MMEFSRQQTVSTNIYPLIQDRRRLGRSVWLYLILTARHNPTDRYVRSGDSIRAQELANALDVSERQARRDLQRLRKAGYLELQNTGRGFRIRIVASFLGSNGPLTEPTSSMKESSSDSQVVR